MLGRFGKPRWQHRKASVRLKSVEQLDHQQPEQLRALQLMATGDSDTTVRCAAISQLVDTTSLLQFFRNEKNDAIRQAASQRLIALLEGQSHDSPHLGNRLRTIRLLHEKALLTQLLHGQAEDACIEAVLDNLHDQSLLYQYALEGRHLALRERAAKRIIDVTLLQQLQQQGRDKKVVQHARERLKQQQQESQEKRQQEEALSQWLGRLKQHIEHVDDPLFAATQQLLTQQWQALQEHAQEQQRSQAVALLQQGQQQLIQQQERQRAAERQQEEVAARQQTLATLQRYYQALNESHWEQELPALDQQFTALCQQWLGQRQYSSPDASEQHQYDNVCENWLQLKQSLQQLMQLHDAIDHEADTPGAADELKAQFRSIVTSDWPRDIPLPSVLQKRLTELAASSPAPIKRHTAKPRHIGLLHQLRQAIGSRNLKQANRAWQRLMHALEKYPDTSSQTQAESLFPSLEELRDWHAFAANPKKDSLCQRMQALAETPLAHPEEQANAIQALHDEWHRLMSSDQDADQTQWDQFKQASDRAYEPCKAHFKELDAIRQANLQARQKISQQLQDFLAQIDWQRADAHKLWEIRRQAPIDWQAASPVRFTDAREVNRQFHQQLKTLDSQLEKLSQQNLPERQRLIDQLQEAQTMEDTQKAIELTRQIQEQWRHSGWVHPRYHRKLDKQRRQLAEKVFKRRDRERQALQQQQAQMAERFKQALDDAENKLNQGDETDLAAAIASLRALDTPRGQPALVTQRDTLITRIREAQQQWQQLARWQQWQHIITSTPSRAAPLPQLEHVCVEMELHTGCDSPDNAQAQRLTVQASLLEQAMKRSHKITPDEACLALLEDNKTLIETGLHDATRERLLTVLHQCGTLSHRK